jgi:hypothetical protein
MWWYRFLFASAGLCGVVVLTTTLSRPSASGATAPASLAPPAPLPPPPQPDRTAEQLLEQASDRFSPDRLTWLENGIWQKVDLPGLVYEADGSYRMAPGHRFRLEVHTHTGPTEGTMLVVSDGADIWQASRVGSEAWFAVSRLKLHALRDTLDSPHASPRLRAEFFQGPTFSGPAPLLRRLRGELVWARREAVRRGDRDGVRLTGVWPTEKVHELAPGDKPWPACMPRQCLLYLDAQTLWPQRIEWWGEGPPGTARLLIQMEFPDPVFNHPLPADRCARVFSFEPPGDAPIEDRTKGVAADLTSRARELARESAH